MSDNTLLEDLIQKPQFRLVAVHEDGWDQEILDRCGGKIWTVYLYDYRRNVHVCELTPSYECHYIETYPEVRPDDDEEYEALQDLLDEAQSDNGTVDYYHCRGIDKIPYPSHRHRLLRDYSIEESEGLTYDETLEEELEYVRCNGGLYAGDPLPHHQVGQALD
jgi:hypothetical protein